MPIHTDFAFHSKVKVFPGKIYFACCESIIINLVQETHNFISPHLPGSVLKAEKGWTSYMRIVCVSFSGVVKHPCHKRSRKRERRCIWRQECCRHVSRWFGNAEYSLHIKLTRSLKNYAVGRLWD